MVAICHFLSTNVKMFEIDVGHKTDHEKALFYGGTPGMSGTYIKDFLKSATPSYTINYMTYNEMQKCNLKCVMGIRRIFWLA